MFYEFYKNENFKKYFKNIGLHSLKKLFLLDVASQKFNSFYVFCLFVVERAKEQ